MPKYEIHPQIEYAETMPSSFYRSTQVFESLREKVFAKSWQFVGSEDLVSQTGSVHPFTFEGTEEPMLLCREGEQLSILSNVCTHRGNILCHHPAKARSITCAYHGRRFGLDGKFQHMPQFKEAKNFPRPADNLHEFPILKWGPWLFASLGNAYDFSDVIDAMQRKVGFMPLEEFKLYSDRGKDYHIKAHWALYCDNYLEGFHIPFVHADLNAALDYGNYETVLFKHANLQIGYADGDESTFDFPEAHEDFGKSIAAYYFWIFPNMMFNFYPWGLSVNIVRPISKEETKVTFISYVYDEGKLDLGAGTGLDKVEQEDEEVVEGVQLGMKSSVYQTGRYSPEMEKGVHHFHRLLVEFLNE
ncbi:aromatic ring-hydroxylating oxygenase subunit alpha [Roseivirga sp.]|uniref:aromatic ring-hydroxylating oxygenase subunit alpha n=1 Tax=Roseivirga sp. TaxID=1964215 RepID=UPI003B8B85F8